MAALVCGSMAYDTIMVFEGKFTDHILADKIHMLNVSFLVPNMRREFGGCAGNIVYNMHLLGVEGHAMGVVGHDFGPYRDWMKKFSLSERHVLELGDEFTAQAYITTDLDDNQITAFHPGAMNQSATVHVPNDGSISVGIVAPDGRDGMIQHAREFKEAGIPFIFDPGQALPLFDSDDLKRFIEQATWVTVNDYEMQLVQERTGWSPGELADKVDALIVTRGSKGSHIYTGGRRIEIPTAKVAAISDPTGCGDAYRAGLLYGIMRELDWERTGRIASLLGAIKIEKHGTQNHYFTQSEFAERYLDSFGEEIDI
ncbi:MAG: carbohydrate kinase family protein [Pseudomonadota bacterium]